MNEKYADVLNKSARDFRLSDIIVFPDSIEDEDFEPIPKIEGAPKCADDGNTFCENFERYPHRHLSDILPKHTLYKDLFGEDEVPDEMRHREDGENFVCGAVDRTVFPKLGKTKDNKWKFIINQGVEEGFVQGVRIETCRSQGRPCDIIGELPNGYVTACKQKYVYRRLLSLNNVGIPVQDTFQLPSACCCAYRRNLDFLAQFGSLLTRK